MPARFARRSDAPGLRLLPRADLLASRSACRPGRADLPPLPRATRLSCGYCPWLTCLPALPAGLTQLYCIYCQRLTSLPALPATLSLLSCGSCTGIVSLPALPTTLTELVCDGCPRLSFLPALPATLTYLECSDWAVIPDVCPSALTRLDGVYPDRRTKWPSGMRASVLPLPRCYPPLPCCTCRKIETPIARIQRHAHKFWPPCLLQLKPLRLGRRLGTWQQYCAFAMLRRRRCHHCPPA